MWSVNLPGLYGYHHNRPMFIIVSCSSRMSLRIMKNRMKYSVTLLHAVHLNKTNITTNFGKECNASSFSSKCFSISLYSLLFFQTFFFVIVVYNLFWFVLPPEYFVAWLCSSMAVCCDAIHSLALHAIFDAQLENKQHLAFRYWVYSHNFPYEWHTNQLKIFIWRRIFQKFALAYLRIREYCMRWVYAAERQHISTENADTRCSNATFTCVYGVRFCCDNRQRLVTGSVFKRMPKF